MSVHRTPTLGRLASFSALFALATAQAAFVMDVDVDGADDGAVTFNPGFSFGGDTSAASQSAAASAFGLSGADSIFGGNGVSEPDTYVYRYNPALDPDNLAIPVGTDLGGGNLATGITGGNPGLYAVYATWPYTENVSGGDTAFAVETTGDSFFLSLDQNFKGNEWIKLGEIFWTSGAITVTQHSQTNTFVSMRSAGMLFEALEGLDPTIPEPSAVVFVGLPALLGLLATRRRRA